jgi:hypothetical protein
VAKRNYDSFIQFARKNKNLTRTDVYWKYREQGGKIKKQTALDLLRDLTKVEKQQQRSQTVGKLIKDKVQRQKVNIKDHDYKSLESPIINQLYDHIKELYNTEDDQRKFLKVGITNENDQYTTVKDFSIFIPTEKDQMGVKGLATEIIKNMKTYYKNLAKKYSTKGSVVSSTLDSLTSLTADIKKIKGMTRQEMQNAFLKNGFQITGYELFEFRD